MLPSMRRHARDRSRTRTKTVRIWRCADCGATFDAQPLRMQSGIRRIGMCPNLNCGDSSIRTARVKD